MIDKIIEVLAEVWEKLLPWIVIPYYDRGVRLRFGKPKGVLEYGFHWKIPFFDQIDTVMIKPTTINLPDQTITTKDNKSIVVRAVVKYEIRDVQKLLLEVNSAQDACGDMIQGEIRNTLILLNWDECNNLELGSVITKKARVEARRWGIEVIQVTLTDLGEMRTIRLMGK